MKTIFALFIILSLLLVGNLNFIHARKDMGEYWKKMMNDQPMPETIKDLIQVQKVSDAKTDHFLRDFDVKPNVILYHTHVESKMKNQKAFDHRFEAVSTNNQKDLKAEAVRVRN